MEDVYIEVNVPPGTSAKEIKCNLSSKQISLSVKGQEMFKNPGFDFSGADISGNYAGGGPDFSNLGK
ncbi:UNVERIFIED_CONTAM: hypothetical protein FKN15_062648 [Acipenser sinensis]